MKREKVLLPMYYHHSSVLMRGDQLKISNPSGNQMILNFHRG